MKAAFVTNPSEISVIEVEKPSLNPGDILVEMNSCGICGSDIEKVFGKYGQPSMKLGHEPAGKIISVGSKVTNFKEGDRVFTHHHVPCYSCHYCKHGNETMCQKYYETNLLPCGLSQEYIVPEWNIKHGGVLKIPESLSYDEAAMIEPLACCVRSWNKISYQKEDSVAILGIGPTGMMHSMLAQNFGFKEIFCLDINDFRLNFAKKLNVTDAINSSDPKRKEKILLQTSNRGVDVVIVATGNLNALQDAIDLVRKGGTIMMFGVPSKNATLNLDMSIIYSKEVSLLTSYAASDIDTKQALDLIHSKKVDVKKLITHRYSLSESQKAFDHARDGANAMKIIIHK